MNKRNGAVFHVTANGESSLAEVRDAWAVAHGMKPRFKPRRIKLLEAANMAAGIPDG